MKHLTIDLIQKELVEKFLNKKVANSSEVECAVARVINDFYKNTKWGKNYSFSYDTKNWSVDITYKGSCIGRVEIKRIKGEHHYSYWGSYTDYTYKAFNVWLWENDKGEVDVEGRLDAIDKIDEERKAAAVIKLDKAKEIFKMIKQALGKDDTETRQFIKYMNDNRYSISE